MPVGCDFYIVYDIYYLFISKEEKQYSRIDDKSKNAKKCQVDTANIEYLITEKCNIFILYTTIYFFIIESNYYKLL